MSKISDRAVRRLKERALVDIDEGVIPSCQLALALEGEVVFAETLGEAPDDARYSIWSATKPIFASVVWQLMGEGLLDPTTPVIELWPGFGKHGKEAVTLEHLLLFTAGFPNRAVTLAALGDRDASVAQMEEWDLEFEPGSAYAYHGVSAHSVMAELVHRVAGDHRVALRQRILDPLGLSRLELGVPEGQQEGIRPIVDGGEHATVEELAEFLGLPSLPPEVAAGVTQAAGGTASSPAADLGSLQQPHALAAGVPGAGVVSDAPSVALFYQELLHNSAGVWDPAILADVTGNVRNTMAGTTLGVLAMRTLGLEVQGDDPTARFRAGSGVVSPRTFGHGGAAGQVAWADPETGLSFSYLTDGCDRHAIRQGRRVRELSAAAVACVGEPGL